MDLANFDEEMLKQITTGACISVNGELTESIGSGQAAEVQARGIEAVSYTHLDVYKRQAQGYVLEIHTVFFLPWVTGNRISIVLPGCISTQGWGIAVCRNHSHHEVLVSTL